MRVFLIFAFLTLSFSNYVSSQNFNNIRKTKIFGLNNSNSILQSRGVNADDEMFIYQVGDIIGANNFDSTLYSSVDELYYSEYPNIRNGYISRYFQDSLVLDTAIIFESSNNIGLFDVAIDPDLGDVYVLGLFYGELSFNDTVLYANCSTDLLQSNRSIFILKLDSNLNVINFNVFGQCLYGYSIDVSNLIFFDNHLYVAHTTTSNTSVSKFDNSLNEVWSISNGNYDMSYGLYLEIDDSANIYIAYNSYSEHNIFAEISSGGTGSDMKTFILSLDSSGNYRWHYTYFNTVAGTGGTSFFDFEIINDQIFCALFKWGSSPADLNPNGSPELTYQGSVIAALNTNNGELSNYHDLDNGFLNTGNIIAYQISSFQDKLFVRFGLNNGTVFLGQNQTYLYNPSSSDIDQLIVEFDTSFNVLNYREFYANINTNSRSKILTTSDGNQLWSFGGQGFGYNNTDQNYEFYEGGGFEKAHWMILFDNCNDDDCNSEIIGCTDSSAFNYNPAATLNDENCEPIIIGCMSIDADNYNSEANTDDGCIYYGCTYANSINYDPTANTDDGSCIDAIYGCTDQDADNYFAEANVDNGQCQYFGCIDPAACNYDASKNADDGTCYYLSLELYSIDNSCSGGSLAQITSNVNGGFGNLSYSWDTGESSEDLFNLSAGNYDLTVSDQNGCTVSESATISEPSIDAELFSPEICYITVDDNTGFNKIVVNPINHESIGGYVIYKEVLTDTYYPIATLDANTLEYVDSTSNPLINSDRYKVNVIDNCLFESEQSDAHRTVHLSMNAGLNNSVNLIWNKYDGFEVSSYMVFRGQSVSNMQFVGFIAGSQNSYTDLSPPAGTSIYQVRIVAPICNQISSDANANIALIADTLKSNIVEHDYEEQNDSLGVNIIANNPSCATCTDGSIIAIAYGGLPDYSYTWLNGVNTNFNLNLNEGVYTLYLSDSNGELIVETITLTAESSEVLGCTDSEAVNYNADATGDDGSCEYPVVDNPCDITPSGLFVDNIIHERVAFNWSAPSSAPSYYMIRYRPVGTSSWTVMSAGPQNDVPFTGTSRTRYFMEPGTTYQWNIRARVVDENGATVCQSPWSASHQYTTLPACANLTDLSVNSEANLVYFNANKPSGDWGVWQAKGKIREVGSNNYRYLATTEDSYTNQIKYNFTPSTDYEWHTKAWCTGNVDEDGNSDPQYHSGWGEFSAFTTQDPCDKLPTNLSTSSGNNANTAITMSWDTPTSGQPHHYFLELTNETTGQVFSWNNLAGSSMSKTKYGQSSGDQFKWRIRGACGENGTSWATPFTGYEYYTLGGDRLGNDSQLNSPLTNISVYPNPSRGEFMISFDLESRQDIYLSITNYLGKVVFTEQLKDQEGQYSKSIDLGNKANGIYMLNITTNNQNINQKIVIQ